MTEPPVDVVDTIALFSRQLAGLGIEGGVKVLMSSTDFDRLAAAIAAIVAYNSPTYAEARHDLPISPCFAVAGIEFHRRITT